MFDKPGTEVVEEIYGDSESSKNYYISSFEEITKPEPEPDPEQPDSDPNPGQPGESTGAELSNAGQAVIATARGTYWTAVEIDRLNNRLGDARYAKNGQEGIWIRLRRSSLGTDTGLGDFESDNMTYQLGYDHAIERNNGRFLIGTAFDYMDTDLDYRGIQGEGNTDRFGISIYGTWLADNGFYADLVGRWGRLDNDFNIVTSSGSRINADYDNNMWAASVELGHKLQNQAGMFLEPNVQLQYTLVTDAEYRTSQNTKVQQDNIHSLIARFGTRLGQSFGEKNNHVGYIKADVFREFLGEQKFFVQDATTINANGDVLTIQNKGFWMDIGAGWQSQFGKNSYGFADLEYRFGNDLDKSWILNAGLRYEF